MAEAKVFMEQKKHEQIHICAGNVPPRFADFSGDLVCNGYRDTWIQDPRPDFLDAKSQSLILSPTAAVTAFLVRRKSSFEICTSLYDTRDSDALAPCSPARASFPPCARQRLCQSTTYSAVYRGETHGPCSSSLTTSTWTRRQAPLRRKGRLRAPERVNAACVESR